MASGTAPASLDALLKDLQSKLASGETDPAAAQRFELLKLLLDAERRAQPASPRNTTLAAARLIGAQLFLPRLELDKAEECLAPYLGERVAELDELARSPESRMLAGLLYAETGNLLFRRLEMERGLALAGHGVDLLATAPSQSGDKYTAIYSCLAPAWLARLAWHAGQRDAARERIAKCIAQTQHLRSDWPHKAIGGIDLVLAVQLDLAAEFYASSGQTDMAALYAQWGVMLLRESTAQDCARLGHLLYVLGKAEARRGRADGYRFASSLLRSARREYARADDTTRNGHAHPFRFRAMTQEAQCLVRAGELEAAEALLSETESAMGKASITALEREHCTAYVTVTRVWILERQARGSSWSETLTRSYREAAERLLRLFGTSRSAARLRSDAYLHLGVANSHLGEHEHAMRALDSAERLAREEHHATTSVAVEFARSEALLACTPEALEPANRHFERGSGMMLDGIRNEYLEDWRMRLAARLNHRLLIWIDPDMSAGDAVDAARRNYLRFRLQRWSGRDQNNLAESMGMSRHTLTRWIHELGLREEFDQVANATRHREPVRDSKRSKRPRSRPPPRAN
jgi:tetratricopeptide (TPR) repeat protein